MGDDRQFTQREDDRLIGQLIQRVEDMIELSNTRERSSEVWRKGHDDDSKLWRASIDARIKPVEDWVNQANWSWKLVVGAVAFTGIIFKSWDWVRLHFLRP